VSFSEPPWIRFSRVTIYARGWWKWWARGGPKPPVGEPTMLLLSPPSSGYFRLLIL
jgi:hypothetical protein